MNGMRTFMPAITIFVVSFLIIHQFNLTLWGEFVAYLLVVNLIAHVINWGSKEYLIRQFSKKPYEITNVFYTNLFSRGILLVVGCMALLLFFEVAITLWLSIWLIGLFFYQSSESLIIYAKKFRLQLVSEVVALLITVSYVLLNMDLSVVQIIQIFTIVTWLKALVMFFSIYPKQATFRVRLDELKYSLPFFIIGLSGLLQSRVDQYIIAANCDKETIATYQLFFSAFILLQSLSAIIFVPFNKTIYRIGIGSFQRVQVKILLLSTLLILLLTPCICIVLIYFFQLEIDFTFYLFGALFAFPPFIYVPIIYLFYRVKKEKEIMYVNYIGAAFNLLLTYYFVLYGNPYNAIIASVVAQWAMLFWYSYRKKAIIDEIKMSRL